jgi:hypothetical protein
MFISMDIFSVLNTDHISHYVSTNFTLQFLTLETLLYEGANGMKLLITENVTV